MRTIATSTLALLLGVAATSVLNAQPPMPRPAPEIAIAEPGGKTTQLSSYKGKVVVLALVSTICPHCQKECEVLTQLQGELKPKGVQMLAIAFNDNAAALVPAFVREHGVMFPVGAASPDKVLSFLGFSVMERYNVPQMAVIDRKGMIRAQSGPLGDPKLQDPAQLRTLLLELAGEGAAAPTKTSTSKAAPATKAPPKGSTN